MTDPTEPRLPLDTVDVTFTIGTEPVRTVAVDLDRARTLIADDETDLGPVVARIIAEDIVRADPFAHAGSTQAIVEVVSPDTLAGKFAVAMSLRVATAGPRTDKTQHNSMPLSQFEPDEIEDDKLLRFGFLGRRLQPTVSSKAETLLAAARLTPPDDVVKSFDFIGSVYGDSDYLVPGDPTPDDIAKVDEIVRRQNEGAGFHDRGWAARSLVTGEIGFLIREGNETKDFNDHQARQDFWDKHRLVLQHCTRDSLGEAVDLILCFVPFDRLDEVPVIAYEIEELARAPLDPAFDQPR